MEETEEECLKKYLGLEMFVPLFHQSNILILEMSMQFFFPHKTRKEI